MNMYIIGGMLTALLLVSILDKGQIFKDLGIIVALVIVSGWAVILYGLISPVVLILAWLLGPLLRWMGLWPKTGCTGVVWSKVMMSLIPKFGGRSNDTKIN